MADGADSHAIVRRPRAIVRRGSDALARLRPSVSRYAPSEPPFPAWKSYAAQRGVRALAADPEHGAVWLATWGGVLCWLPGERACIRHTSEHGLVGNGTRAIAVDGQCRVWAAGESGGLACLEPGQGNAWAVQQPVQDWLVTCLAARPSGGVFLSLRGAAGRYAIAELPAPGEQPNILEAINGLAKRDVEAMCAGVDRSLWLGNAWGLHRFAHGSADRIELDETGRPEQVRAIAQDFRGEVWVGTQRGLFQITPGGQPRLVEGPPRVEIASLAPEPDGSGLWVVMPGGLGRLADGIWQAVATPPELLAGASVMPDRRTWVGGLNGLYEASVDAARPVFAESAAEDWLGNGVQCLLADEAEVWIGSAEGLCHFDGEDWHIIGEAEGGGRPRDVRALARGEDGQLWVGAWGGGPGFWRAGTYYPDRPITEPILGLAKGANGEIWAAAPDALYRREAGARAWTAIVPPDVTLRERVIQGLSFQRLPGAGGAGAPTVWVATSGGLLRYRPEVDLWDAPRDWQAAGGLDEAPIQALAADEAGDCLWVGTPKGLYRHDAVQASLARDVCALAIGRDRSLWVGTPAGLERWRIADRGGRLERASETYQSANSGLAADHVTALAARNVGGRLEVWVGTPAGVSAFRYG